MAFCLSGGARSKTIDPVTGLATTDIGAVMKGNADVNAQAEDLLAVSGIRNLLFNEVVPGVGFGQDLIALDIERRGTTASDLTTRSASASGFQP